MSWRQEEYFHTHWGTCKDWAQNIWTALISKGNAARRPVLLIFLSAEPLKGQPHLYTALDNPFISK